MLSGQWWHGTRAQAPATAPAIAAASPTPFLWADQSRRTQARQIPRPTGTATNRATTGSLSIGTLGNIARTINVPRSQPPRPMMMGYSDRSTALALVPKPPRLCTHQAIHSSESTASVASGSARPRKTLAIVPKLFAGVKSMARVLAR